MMEPLVSFLKKNSDVDVFCFQEVYHEAHGKDTLWTDGSDFNTLNQLKDALSGYTCFYRPHLADWWGLAIFVKKGTDIIEEGEFYVHKFKGHNMEMEVRGYTAKNLHYVKVRENGRSITLINFHGLWNGQGKNDTEDRLNQSKKTVEFISSLKEEIIFCGDFNLTPETKSLQMIEKELGLRNLIQEHGITSTRTSKYTKPCRFADYMFVSPNVEVIDFKVLPDEVSDHSSLYIEFK
jgi:endonuclease/exonuclease/phosphatase family metal-dependent hydrolase